MANTGWLMATGGSSHFNPPAATQTWSNTANIGADDTNYATVTAASSVTSYTLLSDHTVSIPAGSTIHGIQVEVMHETNLANSADGQYGTITVRQHGVGYAATTVSLPQTTGMTLTTAGGSTSLWGASWTVDGVTGADFGVGVWINGGDGGVGGADSSVDYIRVKIYYSTPITAVYSSAAFGGTTTASVFTVTPPNSSAQVGDVALMLIVTQSDTDTILGVIDGTDAYPMTRYSAAIDAGASGFSLYAYYRVLGTGEPGVGNTDAWRVEPDIGGYSEAALLCFRGVDTTTPFESAATSYSYTNTTSTDIISTGITFGASNSRLIGLIGANLGTALGAVFNTGTPTASSKGSAGNGGGTFTRAGIQVFDADFGGSYTTWNVTHASVGTISWLLSLKSIGPADGSAPVNTVAPTITGVPYVGSGLFVNSVGTWTNAPTSYGYQWKQETAPGSGVYSTILLGATSSSRSNTTSDIGLGLKCEVTATNEFGTSAFVPSSNAMGPVLNTTASRKPGSIFYSLDGRPLTS